MWRKALPFFAYLGALLAMAGCGQTGPLLLPTGDTNEQVDAVMSPQEEDRADEEEEN